MKKWIALLLSLLLMLTLTGCEEEVALALDIAIAVMEEAERAQQIDTLPAIPEPAVKAYPREYFDLDNAAKIPCRQVLGAYVVEFTRE